MHHEQLQSFLTTTEQDGLAQLHLKGYNWFKSTFLPHLRLADEILPDHAELIADCWYLAADICDFNNAPLKAIEYYKKALEYDEMIDGAYRELAYMHLQIGAYKVALEYTEMALKHDPDNQEILEQKTKIIDHINYNHQAFYVQDNISWQYNEWLAAEQFEKLIAHFEGHKSSDTALLRRFAAALAALNKNDECLQIWQQIGQSKSPFVLDYFDWFYLPKALSETLDFWTLLQTASPFLEEADYLFCDTLIDNYMPSLNESSLLYLIATWKINSLKKDTEQLQQLAQKYPLWLF